MSMLSADIAENWRNLMQQVAAATLCSGRPAKAIKIIGVSKFQSAEAIAAAIRAGLRDIGENRVQEAAAKRPEVDALLADFGIDSSLVRWHFVGRLQSNKAAKAAALFDVIQSVDSLDLANRLERACQTLNKQLAILIEVNTSGEATKGGVSPEMTLALRRQITQFRHLNFRGLMSIGPLTDDETCIRQAFDVLRNLRAEIERILPAPDGRLELSMGMSGDFPIAIECGATMVRIGTALFGARNYN